MKPTINTRNNSLLSANNSFVAGGIISFNPNLQRLQENIEAIYRQVDKLLIIDNASDNSLLVEELASTYGSSVYYYNNNDNKGVAVALNQLACNAYWTTTLAFGCAQKK